MNLAIDNSIVWSDFSTPIVLPVHNPSDFHTYIAIPYDSNDEPIDPQGSSVSGTFDVEAKPLAAPFYHSESSGESLSTVSTRNITNKPLVGLRFTQNAAISGCSYILLVACSGV